MILKAQSLIRDIITSHNFPFPAKKIPRKEKKFGLKEPVRNTENPQKWEKKKKDKMFFSFKLGIAFDVKEILTFSFVGGD